MAAQLNGLVLSLLLLIAVAVESGLKIACLKSQVQGLDNKVRMLTADIRELEEDYASLQSPATLSQLWIVQKLETNF